MLLKPYDSVNVLNKPELTIMKSSYSAALLIITMLCAPQVLGNQQDDKIKGHELRLLPSPCAVKTSDHYHSTNCEAQRFYVSARLKDCEIERDGLLVRDEARDILVCVKANKPSSQNNMEF